jgi:indolepyruvate ferredoxin oxidoreductase
VRFPQLGVIKGALDESTRRAVYLDPAELSKNLFDNEQFTNMLLVGAAYQTGVLPISADAIERAITLNGAAVERNLQAFRRGRQAVADPAAVDAAINATRTVPAPSVAPAAARAIAATVAAAADSELARLVELRVAELISYQDQRYAMDYARFVEDVRIQENRAVPGSTVLTEAVAMYLHKLMAYKDEYEVARLAFDPAFDAAVRNAFGDDAKRAVRLHPPMLRAMGMKNKLSLGTWANPALRTLARMRKVRGTKLDVFGYHEVRRTERALIVEYRAVITDLLTDLTAQRIPTALQIAALPDVIRGYEGVKMANVEAYHDQLKQLRELHREPRPALAVGS